MPQGLEIKNAAGVVVLTTTTRLGKVLGSTVVSSNGSTSVPGFSLGSPFVICYSGTTEDAYPNNFDRAASGNASISGTTLSWTGSSWQQRQLVYGVY